MYRYYYLTDALFGRHDTMGEASNQSNVHRKALVHRKLKR